VGGKQKNYVCGGSGYECRHKMSRKKGSHEMGTTDMNKRSHAWGPMIGEILGNLRQGRLFMGGGTPKKKKKKKKKKRKSCQGPPINNYQSEAASGSEEETIKNWDETQKVKTIFRPSRTQIDRGRHRRKGMVEMGT